MGNTETPNVVTATQAAEMLGKPVQTVNRWAREGHLSAFFEPESKRGQQRLFLRADIEALLTGAT